MRARVSSALGGALLLCLAVSARAEKHLVVTGGLQMLSLQNDLATSTNTDISKAFYGNVDFYLGRGRKGGGLAFGLRASYLTSGVATDTVTVSYSQIPIYLTVSKEMGGKGLLKLRPFVGAGWMLTNQLTYDGVSTRVDGSYAGSGFTMIAGMQVFLALLGQKLPRVVLEGGYVYSLQKVLRSPAETADDLDGDPSGFFFGGGLGLSF